MIWTWNGFAKLKRGTLPARGTDACMTNSDKAYGVWRMAYMVIRLLEMRRLLKPTGLIWLHCDPTMSHYLKLAMDAIFGRKMFRNEIVWKRNSSHNDSKGLARFRMPYCFTGI